MLTFFAIAAIALTTFGQAPSGFTYQSVLRDANNDLIINTAVGTQISILQTTAGGTAVYVETHAETTNANGLLTLQVGAGSVQSGTFANIDWSAGPYFIKAETDPAGGATYTITGTQQMMSVPYALYAANSGNATPTIPDLEAVLAENNSANNQQIKDLQDPTDPQDAVTKNYTYSKAEVDALIANLQSQIDNTETASVTDID